MENSSTEQLKPAESHELEWDDPDLDQIDTTIMTDIFIMRAPPRTREELLIPSF